MTFDLQHWLDEVIEVHPRYQTPKKVRRAEYFYYLIYANGSINVSGWGCLSTSATGHQQGLEQSEALHLQWLSGFIKGLEYAGYDTKSFWDGMNDYAAKWDTPTNEN